MTSIALPAPAAPHPGATRVSLFRSFVQGGFECSTHRRRDGRRLDVIAASGHDRHAAAGCVAGIHERAQRALGLRRGPPGLEEQ